MAGVQVIVFDQEARKLADRLSFDDRVVIAQEISAEGEANAPTETGDYRSAFGVEIEDDTPASVNNDPAASFITFGTSDTPPHTGHIDAARRRGIYTGDESL